MTPPTIQTTAELVERLCFILGQVKDDRTLVPVPIADVREAATRLEHLERALTWQPIETAPKDGTDILAWWFGISFPQIARWAGHPFYGGPGWFQCSYSAASLRCEPTHWQPLPEPPALTQSGNK